MKPLITALFVTSCLTVPAFAQTTPAPAESPAATTTDTMTPETGTDSAASATTADAGGFLTYQEGSQALGSGLMGATVRGTDNADIGTVSDIVLDRGGQVQAVIVGVGGFLGIGEKDVAIANDQLQFVLASEAAASADTVAPTDTAVAPTATDQTTTSAATPAPADGAAPAPSDATGTAAMGTNTSGMTAGQEEGRLAWNGAGIDHIQVNFTREQLENAPAFEAAE